MRTKDDIKKYLNEAEHRVSFTRKVQIMSKIISGNDSAPVAYPEEKWHDERVKAIKAGIDKIKRDLPDIRSLNAEEYLYWEGVMSSLRWVLGDEKNNLDT